MPILRSMQTTEQRQADFIRQRMTDRLQRANERTIDPIELSFLMGWLVFGVGRPEAVGMLKPFRNAHGLMLANLSQPELAPMGAEFATMVAEART